MTNDNRYIMYDKLITFQNVKNIFIPRLCYV